MTLWFPTPGVLWPLTFEASTSKYSCDVELDGEGTTVP